MGIDHNVFMYSQPCILGKGEESLEWKLLLDIWSLGFCCLIFVFLGCELWIMKQKSACNMHSRLLSLALIICFIKLVD